MLYPMTKEAQPRIGSGAQHVRSSEKKDDHMEVSTNGGTPKWMVFIGQSYLVGGLNPSEKY